MRVTRSPKEWHRHLPPFSPAAWTRRPPEHPPNLSCSVTADGHNLDRILFLPPILYSKNKVLADLSAALEVPAAARLFFPAQS